MLDGLQTSLLTKEVLAAIPTEFVLFAEAVTHDVEVGRRNSAVSVFAEDLLSWFYSVVVHSTLVVASESPAKQSPLARRPCVS